jgi:urease accessory protein UreH
MKLLTPRARGLSAWACTSSFGGGLVAGDQTRLDVRVGAGARCFLGTQAATKVYRNPASLPSGHETTALLEKDSLLVFAPDPVQAFAKSTYAQRQTFHLAPDASLVLLDWFTSGRAARGERWAFSHFSSRNEVFTDPLLLLRGGEIAPDCVRARHPATRVFDSLSSSEEERVGERRPFIPKRQTSNVQRATSDAITGQGVEELILLDSIRFDPADGPLDASHRAGRFNCFASLFVIGPLLRDLAAGLQTDFAARPVTRRAAVVGSSSPIRDGVLLRLAGEHVEPVTQELHAHLSPLVPLLGDDPWARKW